MPQALLASGREPRRPRSLVKIPAQLSEAGEANAELVVACPGEYEPSLFEDGSYRTICRVDKRLEGRIDQAGDPLALSRRGDGDEWPLQPVRLDQDERAAGHQVLPGSLEGMDHARNLDSSK